MNGPVGLITSIIDFIRFYF